MKTKSKALLLSLCAVLLVTVSVLGTMAYLTSTDSVENTFTVGSVAIELDEADVDDTDKDSNTTERDKANTYHLLPGHTYAKDPTVHVNADSEDCWVFVKVENGIAAYEAATTTGEDAYTSIADQILANGWTALGTDENVYYKEYDKESTEANKGELLVFSQFKIADNANEESGWSNIKPDTTKINVTGYAVQKDGFDSASPAWNATFGAPATEGE